MTIINSKWLKIKNTQGLLHHPLISDGNGRIIIGPKNIETIVIENSETSSKRSIAVIGNNYYGRLGLGDTTNISQWEPVEININIKQIAITFCSTYLLSTDGNVYVCGGNNYGQLGLDNTTNKYTFTLIPNFNNIKQIAASPYSALFLKEDGTVYGCGSNTYGELGLEIQNTKYLVPTLIPNISNVQKIFMSRGWNTYENSFFILNNGDVYGCGCNSYGELGLNDTEIKIIPTKINGLSNIKDINIYGTFTLFLTNDGYVYSCGTNSYGQLGLNDKNSRIIPTLNPYLNSIKQISAGAYHSMVLNTNGELFVWGHNAYGPLGLGNVVPQLIPTQVFNIGSQYEEIGEVEYINAGMRCSFIKIKNKGIYACGWNSYCQTSLGTNTESKYTKFLKVNVIGQNSVSEILSVEGATFLIL